MGNIISYLKEFGSYSFEKMPFHEVDALVLAQFSYLKFEGLVPKITDNKAAVSLMDIYNGMDEAVVFSDERFGKDNRLLFEEMFQCQRFKDMHFNYYATILNEDVETQFCAITCYPQNSIPIVVFRGTDENLVGWKEDFNMAFKEPVPGQRLAAVYLNQVGNRLKEDFYVCGHSKGGNFAVYSSMNSTTEIQKRIRRIYSFDGPGFRPEILKSEDYDKIKEKIEKYIPKSSLVGMILESHEDYIVIDSSAMGLFQHNLFSWKVMDASFVSREEVYKRRQFMNETLNDWILNMDDEQLELFVSTLFSVFDGCDVKTIIEMSNDWKKSINGMIQAYKDVGEESKENLREIMHLFLNVLKNNIKKI